MKAEVNVVKLFRHSHHCIAAMFAAGLTCREVENRTGFSQHRLTVLLGDPTFNQLIEHYSVQALESLRDEAMEYYTVRANNALHAEYMIADHLDKAEAEDSPLKIRELLQISGNFSKSLPKEVNLNVSFGDKLDAARTRMSRAKDITVIEGKATPAISHQPPNVPLAEPSPRTASTGIRRI